MLVITHFKMTWKAGRGTPEPPSAYHSLTRKEESLETGVEEMTQRLRALTLVSLSEDPGSVPTLHNDSHSPEPQFLELQCPLLVSVVPAFTWFT